MPCVKYCCCSTSSCVAAVDAAAAVALTAAVDTAVALTVVVDSNVAFTATVDASVTATVDTDVALTAVAAFVTSHTTAARLASISFIFTTHFQSKVTCRLFLSNSLNFNVTSEIIPSRVTSS